MKQLSSVPNPLPVTFLRGGTSKGIYIKKDYLPSDRAEWEPVFLGIMGSPDPEHGRQLNGMGGGVSSLSKICVVGRPDGDVANDADVDVEYTFCQVGIRDTTLDYSGNCGNLSSMIGVFAVDEGLCQPRTVEGRANVGAVHAFNTNTGKRVDTRFPVSAEDGRTPVLDLPQVSIAGVPGLASRIDLHFVSPAGARTGKLLPTGRAIDSLSFSHAGKTASINASLVDATNPSVFILSEDLARILRRPSSRELSYSARDIEECVEAIRQSGARAMGLNPEAKAQPKIAIIDSQAPADAGAGAEAGAEVKHPRLVTHAFSMGVLHKAIPMTLGLCLGVTARIEATLPWQVVSSGANNVGAGDRSQSRTEKESSDDKLKTDNPVDLIRIKHPSGDVDVGAEFGCDGDLLSAKVVRTGRRLMKGAVWW